MGYAKNHQMEDDDLSEIAAEIAVRAGILSRCDCCDDVYDPLGCHDYEAAYKIGNNLITNQDPLVAPFEGDRRRMTDLVKDIHTRYGTMCHCRSLIEND